MVKKLKQKETTIDKASIAFIAKLLVKEKNARDWMVEQLQEEGPDHKQLQNALLFQQLALFVKALEKITGKKIEVDKGYDLSWSDEENRIDFPIPLPLSTLKKVSDPEKLLKVFVEGPEHETLVYSALIQLLNGATLQLKELKK